MIHHSLCHPPLPPPSEHARAHTAMGHHPWQGSAVGALLRACFLSLLLVERASLREQGLAASTFPTNWNEAFYPERLSRLLKGGGPLGSLLVLGVFLLGRGAGLTADQPTLLLQQVALLQAASSLHLRAAEYRGPLTFSVRNLAFLHGFLHALFGFLHALFGFHGFHRFFHAFSHIGRVGEGGKGRKLL